MSHAAEPTAGETEAGDQSGTAIGPLGALRHRNFALLWTGQTMSSLGNEMFPIIVAIAVLERHSGAIGLGIVLAIQGLAVAGGTAIAASVGDRWQRTRQMISSDVVRAAGVAALALAPLTMPRAAFLGLIAVISVAEGLFLPAYGALVPRLLPKDALQGGNAATALSMYVATVAGPSSAGLLLATVGPSTALWVDVGSFAFSLSTLLLVREPKNTSVPGSVTGSMARRGWQDAREALAAIWQRPWIALSIGSATILMAFAVAPAYLAVPLVARQRLGGPAAYGAIFAALGIGSVIGSIVGGKVAVRRRGVLAVCGLFTIFGAVGSLAILPLPAIVCFWALAGVGVTVYQILWMTALQQDIPDQMLGRVMALDRLGSQGLMPIGYGLAGVAASAFGLRTILLFGACLVIVFAPLALFARGGTTFSTPAGPAT